MSWRSYDPLNLATEPAFKLLPWLIAAVCLFFILATSLFVTTASIMKPWNGLKSGTAALVVPANPLANDETKLTAALVNGLKQSESVNDIQVIDKAQRLAVLGPWLQSTQSGGSLNSAALSRLPLPILIQFQMKDGGQLQTDLDRLLLRLKTISPNVQVFADQNWRQDASNLRRFILAALLTLSLVSLALLILIILLATKASIKAQSENLQTLGILGAEKSYISNVFCGHAAKRGLIAGIVCAVIIIVCLLAVRFSLGDNSVLRLWFDRAFVPTLLVCLATPLIAAVICWIGAHLGVRRLSMSQNS